MCITYGRDITGIGTVDKKIYGNDVAVDVEVQLLHFAMQIGPI